MCCGFPSNARGTLPHRCACPPKVRLEQVNFGCESGNELLCGGIDIGGDIMRPLNDSKNMRGALFSKTKQGYRNSTNVYYQMDIHEIRVDLQTFDQEETKKKLSSIVREARTEACKPIDQGPKRRICQQ